MKKMQNTFCKSTSYPNTVYTNKKNKELKTLQNSG